MNKFSKSLASFVVNCRWWLFVIFLVVTIGCTILIPKVDINYNMTKYLPANSDTKVAIELMENEFGASGTASVMISGAKVDEIKSLVDEISKVENVSSAIFNESDSSYYDSQNSKALVKIFFTGNSYAQETEKAMIEIREICDEYETEFAGEAVSATASRTALGSEMVIILGIAVAIVILILLLTSKSWLEPLVYLCVIGCAILINMGTNLILGEISFITQSISAVMLIALEMDYCIVLCSRYREEENKGLAPKEAMKTALAGSLNAIIASSLTVMAGLLALVFMDYTIGFDIGMVLAKGVLISILAVLFFMPSIILIFSRALKRTQHRSFLPKMDKLGSFAKKTRIIVPLIFVCLITASAILQTGVTFTYVAQMNKEGSQVQIESHEIEKYFGVQNSLVVIVPNTNIELEYKLFNDIKNIEVDGEKYINSASSIAPYKLPMSAEQLTQVYSSYGVTEEIITATYSALGKDQTQKISTIEFVNGFNKYVAPNLNSDNVFTQYYYDQIKSAFKTMGETLSNAQTMLSNDSYDRLIFNINLATDSEKAIAFIEKMNIVLADSGFEKYYVANSTSNLMETQEVFKSDRTKTDIIIVVFMLLIVLFAFRSLSVPILLVLTIQGAIWINIAWSMLGGEHIYFICYLLAMAIQMGATIDYGILLTERYREFRVQNNKLDSMKKALNASITTILTSGLVLVLAAFTIHFVSSSPLLSEVGKLIGRGSLISIIAVLFVLPSLLILFDKVIEKTTLKAKFLNEKAVIETTGEVVSETDAQQNVETVENANSNALPVTKYYRASIKHKKIKLASTKQFLPRKNTTALLEKSRQMQKKSSEK